MMLRISKHLLCLCCAVMLLTSCSTEQDQPTIIIDDAAILTAHLQIMEQYREYNEQLLADFDIDFRVITTTSPEDLNRFSHTAFTTLQSQSRSQSGKALLLVVNTFLDETRLEVSMALEPIYTDGFVSYLERKGMVPYFRDMKVAEGIYMMTELVRDRAFEAAQGQEFMAPMQSVSIGAGAKTNAMIGQVDGAAKQGANVLATVRDSPEDILTKHLANLRKHNKNPDLDIFSEATRAFFKTWTVTDINMDNEYRFVTQCQGGQVIYSPDDQRAVLLFPLKPRNCSPYFFVKEQSIWRLDIVTMAKVVRFNKDMMWHFSLKDRELYNIPYEFVFGGFKYDKNGYPFINKYKYRWGFRCSNGFIEQDENGHCLVSWLAENGAAKNSLGFQINDVVISVGDGGSRVRNPDPYRTVHYLAKIPSGQLAVLTVVRPGVGEQTLRAVAP